jgi:hypothetical protein
MSIMHELIGADLTQVHKTGNLNYRLCDYNTDTADPTSDNGCGAHTDYGTFTIIFQDGTSGLGTEDAEQPWSLGSCSRRCNGCPCRLVRCNSQWGQHPSNPSSSQKNSWCLKTQCCCLCCPRCRGHSTTSRKCQGCPSLHKEGHGWAIGCWEFKEVMGKKWRRREGNEKSDDGDDTETQDSEIERFIWA